MVLVLFVDSGGFQSKEHGETLKQRHTHTHTHSSGLDSKERNCL